MSFIVKWLLRLVPRPWLISLSRQLSPLLKLLYKGHRYIDPIDGSGYRKLFPYGYGKQRANALCPGSWSLERHRLLWLFLKQKTDLFTSPAKLLHMAPEQPFYKQFQNMPHLSYTTADLDSPIAKIKADITALPFPDNTFDAILCNHVLEHIPDDTKAMQELYRVMKPGGWGVFQVPLDKSLNTTYEDPKITSPKERQKHFGQYDHVRVYGMDYFQKLTKAGFEVIASDFVKSLSENEIETYALDSEEIIPFVKKPF